MNDWRNEPTNDRLLESQNHLTLDHSTPITNSKMFYHSNPGILVVVLFWGSLHIPPSWKQSETRSPVKGVPFPSPPCPPTPAVLMKPQVSWGWAGLQDRTDIAQLPGPIHAAFPMMTPQVRLITLRHVTCIQWVGGC